MHNTDDLDAELKWNHSDEFYSAQKSKMSIPWLMIGQAVILFIAVAIGRKVITDISANIGSKVRGENPNISRKALAYMSEAVVAELGVSVGETVVPGIRRQ